MLAAKSTNAGEHLRTVGRELFDDYTLSLVNSDASLLRLMAHEFESFNKETDFRKMLVDALTVTKRQVDYLMDGQRKMDIEQWLVVQRATGSRLYSRFVQLKTSGNLNEQADFHR